MMGQPATKAMSSPSIHVTLGSNYIFYFTETRSARTVSVSQMYNTRQQMVEREEWEKTLRFGGKSVS